MDFAVACPAVVPGALVPVQIPREYDHAAYIEPNAWVRRLVPE